MPDGPVEVEKPWPRKNPVLAEQDRNRKGVLLLVVDNLSSPLSRFEIGVFYMPTLYYFSLDVRNLRIVIVPVGRLPGRNNSCMDRMDIELS